MTRALLVALGMCMLILWLVGVVDGSTWWLVWLDGTAGVLSFLAAAAVSPSTGPLAASAGPGVLGAALGVLFVVGIAAGASAWLVWFTFAFAGGYLALAGLSFVVRTAEPRSFTRTPMSAH
jgi:hypothetical protein